MKSKITRKFPVGPAFLVDAKRIALFRDGKLKKIFPSLNSASKKYKVDLSVLSRGIQEKKHFSFLKENEVLKVISENQYINQEIILFKRHISYLIKTEKLVFNCNFCLEEKGETLPLNNFTVFGKCTQCSNNDDISCSSINYWLISKNYNLQLMDRSKFLRNLMPFQYAEDPVMKTENEFDKKDLESTLVDNKHSVAEIILHEDVVVEKEKQLIIVANEKIGRKQVIKPDSNLLKNEKRVSNGRFVSIIFFWFLCVIIAFFIFKAIIEESKELKKIHQVKAIILEKNSINNTLIYKNIEGNIFKIPNALPFWDCGKEGDSVLVSFKNENNPIFIDVKPLK